MRVVLSILLLLLTVNVNGQELKKLLKYSTIYTATNGGTSISDVTSYSVSNGLVSTVTTTPFDYSLSVGIRKIARFGYENRANAFYDGTEVSWSDAANIGKRDGLEYLFEIDYRRQQGREFINQHHFIRLVQPNFIVKGEYMQDGFVDISYFETTQRFRLKLNEKLSLNVGLVQRLAEPYGYDPLADWLLSDGNLHYTQLAIEEGYSIDVANQLYMDPEGVVVANSVEVWEEVAIPQVLADYSSRMRGDLSLALENSLVVGFDFYKYSKDKWIHMWGNVMPYHYDSKGEFSYHSFNEGQWVDYSGGLIAGCKLNKHLGLFLEGTYNKYWNREWYGFKVGLNYVVL